MRRTCGLACIVLLGITATALSKPVLPPQPITQRVSLADVVVAGRVTGMEDMDIETVLVPNGPKVMARIAIVTVGDVLLGDKDLKTVKVAFPVPGEVKPKIGGIRQFVNLQTGKEYLLMLHKHEGGKFFVCPAHGDAVMHNDVNPATDNFDKDVTLAKRCVKLLAEPETGLKSKEADDRLLTATLLVFKYRLTRTGKQEPIAAEESKLILAVLKDADWTKSDPLTRQTPQTLFNQLGLDKNDGWTPPQPVAGQNYATAFAEAARAWIDQNSGTYRIKRFVPEK
jgi:hypothetical protein